MNKLRESWGMMNPVFTGFSSFCGFLFGFHLQAIILHHWTQMRRAGFAFELLDLINSGLSELDI